MRRVIAEDSDAEREDGSDDCEDENAEESEDASSGEESYDYGFAGESDGDDEEGSDCEVDFASMNVSSNILRMLGASEEIIAAKEATMSGATAKWVPPTATGLEHSEAIADSAAVALVGGRNPSGTGVDRVYKTVGGFEKEKEVAAATTTAEEAPVLKDAMKVKIVHAPEPVPSKQESKLPFESKDNNGSDSDDGGSESAWDAASGMEGYGLWDSGPGDDYEVTTVMSPNLMVALGLIKPPEVGATWNGQTEAGEQQDWRPPSFSGLKNSEPITTLLPLMIGRTHGLEVEYKEKWHGKEEDDDGHDMDGDDDWSEEEGWDYEDVPDDEYILDWSTNISPNLAGVIGGHESVEQRAIAMSKELDWKPPTSSGLKNCSPIVDAHSKNALRSIDIIDAPRSTSPSKRPPGSRSSVLVVAISERLTKP